MSNEIDDKLPRSLEVLWKRADRRSRGPQPALSLERIVAAAIELADAEGLQALSMARLAERLGCATMSLYRHVASKDDLLVFMMDTAPGEPPDIELAVHGWRGGLERWARELRALYYRHPWILQITPGRPPLEPGQLAWLDCGLGTMAGIGLSPHEKLAACMLILHYVRGEAQLHLSLSQAKEHQDWNSREMQAWYGRTLARLIDAERFPALAELSAAGAFEPGDDEASESAEFDFGLSRILDGVEMLVRR
ncbi:TetR/AcrR family transcriptional regulator [Archangium lansingense]|uniref:TetR/AcrR family transcriptional regulator n=1 Tax=Archangium lansingense TaxID=2995310 RepID=A0ABT3ZXZ3_9BACT|nr:TetR/AcrR family transcriptional regulator [Archangium lansinium]MCY1074243.1 TetR/AcrR family transcriptional regulator [Archangium lansinium]